MIRQLSTLGPWLITLALGCGSSTTPKSTAKKSTAQESSFSDSNLPKTEQASGATQKQNRTQSIAHAGPTAEENTSQASVPLKEKRHSSENLLSLSAPPKQEEVPKTRIEVSMGRDGHLQASPDQVKDCRATLQARCNEVSKDACQAQWPCQWDKNQCSPHPLIERGKPRRSASYICGIFLKQTEHAACMALRGAPCWQTDPMHAERERCYQFSGDSVQCARAGCVEDIAFGRRGTGGKTYCTAAPMRP